MARRYLGIDFSGAAAPWGPRVRKPTVWVATLERSGPSLSLADLCPVQKLPGPGAPFDRLAAHLRAGAYEVAGIDAPFSIPVTHLPPGGHARLVEIMATLPAASDRPFPLGADLVALAERVRPRASAKPVRRCERIWIERNVNTRSTLWNGPRGGAPFAAACLTLIARSGRPCWPFEKLTAARLAECFPAAQLRHWGLPHEKYNGPDGLAVREAIVAALTAAVKVDEVQRAALTASADALDALIAAFGAVAADTGALADPPDGGEEGWIAVHA